MSETRRAHSNGRQAILALFKAVGIDEDKIEFIDDEKEDANEE